MTALSSRHTDARSAGGTSAARSFRARGLLRSTLCILAIVLAGVGGALLSPLHARAANAPTVSAVVPGQGSYLGGTAITITGTGFLAGAGVTIGGTAATGITVVSATQITATTPAGVVGAAVVRVTNTDGQAGTLGGAFTYLGPPPMVASVSPVSGTSLGDTLITITGTDLVSGATVSVGGVAATNVTWVSSVQLTAKTPARTAGAATIVVTNPDAQTGSLPAGYAYTAATPPTVTGLSPATGSTGGGTVLTITGNGFANGATVSIGGAAATGVAVLSATSITARAPAGAAGLASVVVTNPDTQSGTYAGGYTYVSSATPTVTSVSPSGGPVAGGVGVTITGTGFNAGATVVFGSTALTGVTVVNSTTITATAPAGSAETKAVVTVTNTDGKIGSLTDAYTFHAAPTVTSVTPNIVNTTGGTEVTLAGTGFITGATVLFGGHPGTALTVGSSTQIKVTTPAVVAGIAVITVINGDGQVGSLASGLTYRAGPAIAAITPNTGPSDGGTAITISGTGFGAGVSVKVGGKAATDVVLVDATSLTAKTPAKTPAGATGAELVEVVNADGLKASLVAGFIYTAGTTAAAPGAGKITSGTVAPSGLGLIVFAGGSNQQLVDAALAGGCSTSAKLAFFASDGKGSLVTYVPVSQIAIVNTAWNTRFKGGVPAQEPLIVLCR